MIARSRIRDGFAVVLFVLALAGCGARTSDREAREEAHEDEHRTGPHGGSLVEISPEAVRAAGIAVDTAGPRSIEVVVELPGEIKLNSERSVGVHPTYPGRLVRLNAALGSFVRRGDPLAVIYSTESLSEYTIEAPVSGTVVTRPVSVGAVVDRETPLLTVADLATVWLEFPIYVQNLDRIRRGQVVHARAEGGAGPDASGTISYIGPVLDADTRTTFGRVLLSNRGGRWQPGRLVTAAVVLERATVPIAVPEESIVRIGQGAAVFRSGPNGFEEQTVTPGRSDGATTEIVSGLERGARIVTRGAFLVKAELEKEAGGHED